MKNYAGQIGKRLHFVCGEKKTHAWKLLDEWTMIKNNKLPKSIKQLLPS